MKNLFAACVVATMLVGTAQAQTVVYNPADTVTDCNIIPGQCQTFYPDGTVVTNFTEQTTDPTVVVAPPVPEVAVVVPQNVVAAPDPVPSMFHPGQVIGVVWDCFAQVFVPPGSSPCYGEVLHVLGLTSWGWIKVIDEAGDTWTVNPSRMIGFQELPGLINAQR